MSGAPEFNVRAVVATYRSFAPVVPDGGPALARALERLCGDLLPAPTRSLLDSLAREGEGASARERYQRGFDLEHAVGVAAHLVGDLPVLRIVLEALLGYPEVLAAVGADLLATGTHPGRVEGVLTPLARVEADLSEADVRFVGESAGVGVHVTHVVTALLEARRLDLDAAAVEVVHRLVLDGTEPHLAVSVAQSLVH